MTALEAAELETSARLLSWQTGKRLRIVNPDGQVIGDTGASPPSAAVSPAAPKERTVNGADDR